MTRIKKLGWYDTQVGTTFVVVVVATKPGRNGILGGHAWWKRQRRWLNSVDYDLGNIWGFEDPPYLPLLCCLLYTSPSPRDS